MVPRPIRITYPLLAARWVSMCLAVIAAALIATLTVGCDTPTTFPPIAPGVLGVTPEALVAGVLPTPTPTSGPSPTPMVVPTAHVPPPEPLRTRGGFSVGLFADAVGPVRMLAVAPNGDVLATVPSLNLILAMPDRDANGVADAVHAFAEGGLLNKPHGIAMHQGWLYVANTDGVVRFPYQAGDLQATGAAEAVVELPGEGAMWNRGLKFGPDDLMYVSIGASCDVCQESDIRRAAIARFDADGGEATLYAQGLRNAVGLAFHPETGTLWATDSGRDGLGQDRPPDELNLIVPGAHYGWPVCYGDQRYDGELKADRSFCEATYPPAVDFAAHSAPYGMVFNTGDAFPEEFRGGLFVAQHGQVRKYLPTGYGIVFLPFAEGVPTGEVWPIVDGWLRPDTRRWGSPVDIAQAPDGALLVSDDGGGRVYRIAYDGPRATPTPYSYGP